MYSQTTYTAEESQAFCGVTRELFDLENRYLLAVKSPKSTEDVFRKATLAQVAVELQKARHQHIGCCKTCLLADAITGVFKDGADSGSVRRSLAVAHV